MLNIGRRFIDIPQELEAPHRGLDALVIAGLVHRVHVDRVHEAV